MSSMPRMILTVVFVTGAAAAMAAAQSTQSGQVVIGEDTVGMAGADLRGLDTLNGTTQDLSLAVGQTAEFGYLEITLEACRAPRDAPGSDAFALMSIRDVRDGEQRFSGWMFASSPALSALDHPRYDVWVLRCNSA